MINGLTCFPNKLMNACCKTSIQTTDILNKLVNFRENSVWVVHLHRVSGGIYILNILNYFLFISLFTVVISIFVLGKPEIQINRVVI